MPVVIDASALVELLLQSDRAPAVLQAVGATDDVRRFPTLPLLPESWALRASLTPYDACYVALARNLGCPLVTGDDGSPGRRGWACPLVTV